MNGYEIIKEKDFFETFEGTILRFDPEKESYFTIKENPSTEGLSDIDELDVAIAKDIYKQTEDAYKALKTNIDLFVPINKGDIFFIVSFPGTNMYFIKITLSAFYFGVNP